VFVCVCVCVCMLFKKFSFNSFLFPSELRKLRRIRDLSFPPLFASFLVVGTETMKWRRFLIREYHTMRVLFQCSEQFAKDGNCVERALETDTHGHVQQGRKEYRA
jgi:hypothetical protein